MPHIVTKESILFLYKNTLCDVRRYILNKEDPTDEEVSLLGAISLTLSEGEKLNNPNQER